MQALTVEKIDSGYQHSHGNESKSNEEMLKINKYVVNFLSYDHGKRICLFFQFCDGEFQKVKVNLQARILSNQLCCGINPDAVSKPGIT